MELDLPHIWAAIIAFAVLAYVVLDGFDLGVGILFPMLGSRENRDLATTSIAPVWDGNETWLVLGGGGLLAAFPLAYATVLSALYIPITVMLFGLIFRGVAFEFRWRAERNRWLWDLSFASGSMIATFAQGATLGALVEGLDIADRVYQGGPWDWLSPFSILTGIALVVGYSLLGACWLVGKTEHDLAARARRLAVGAAFGTFLLIGAVSLATPFLHETYFDRWFQWPNAIFSAIVPALLGICALVLYRDLSNGAGRHAFLSAIGLFVLCFTGLGISIYPYVVPHSLTITGAAAPDKSLSFLLVGAVVLIPIILGYTCYAYYVFRGKTELSDH